MIATHLPDDQPHAWTEKDVARRLVLACKRDGRLTDAAAGAPALAPADAHGDPQHWPARYVGRMEDRFALERWAHAKAGWEVIEDVCRDLRISRSTFEDRRRRALGDIADALNRDARPSPTRRAAPAGPDRSGRGIPRR